MIVDSDVKIPGGIGPKGRVPSGDYVRPEWVRSLDREATSTVDAGRSKEHPMSSGKGLLSNHMRPHTRLRDVVAPHSFYGMDAAYDAARPKPGKPAPVVPDSPHGLSDTGKLWVDFLSEAIARNGGRRLSRRKLRSLRWTFDRHLRDNGPRRFPTREQRDSD